MTANNIRPVEELRELLKGGRRRTNKFNAKKTKAYGYTFDSRHEAEYYKVLRMRMESGSISRVHRQVKFDLPGGTTLTVDFQVVHTNGKVSYKDAKGSKKTRAYQEWNRVRKIAEDLYGIIIEEV